MSAKSLMLNAACPVPSTGLEPNTTSPSMNVTVPEGSPGLDGITAALKGTVPPGRIGFAEDVNVVVVLTLFGSVTVTVGLPNLSEVNAPPPPLECVLKE